MLINVKDIWTVQLFALHNPNSDRGPSVLLTRDRPRVQDIDIGTIDSMMLTYHNINHILTIQYSF